MLPYASHRCPSVKFKLSNWIILSYHTKIKISSYTAATRPYLQKQLWWWQRDFYISVFILLFKSRFFVIYYKCLTLADGTKKPSPGGRCPAGADEGGPFCDLLHCSICKKADPHQSKIKDFWQLPPGEAFVAICRNAWYNIEKITTAAMQPRNDTKNEETLWQKFCSSAMGLPELAPKSLDIPR